MKLFTKAFVIVALLSSFTAQPMKRCGGSALASDRPEKRARTMEEQEVKKPKRHLCVEQLDPANPIPTVVLLSSDDEEFEVDRELAEQSQTIKNMLDDLGDAAANKPILFYNIYAQTLGMVITCLQDMQNAKLIVQSLEASDLHALFMAVNFLDIPELLNLCFQQWAEICTIPEALAIFKNNPELHPACDENIQLSHELSHAVAHIINQKLNLILLVTNMIDPLIATLNEHEDQVVLVRFSPDGKTMVSVSKDYIIKIWNLVDENWTCSQILNDHTYYVEAICFSPDGQTFASASWGTIKLWNFINGKWICTQTINDDTERMHSVCFSPDNITLASASDDKTIKLWNVINGKWTCVQILTDHEKAVWSVCCSPDNITLASASHDKTIKLWNVINGKWTCVQTFNEPEVIWSVYFSPDGKLLVCRLSKGLKILKLVDEKWIHSQTINDDTSPSACFSSDGKTLATAGESIKTWDIVDEKWTCTQVLNGDTFRNFSPCISPDGTILASGSYHKTIYLWDMKIANRLKCFMIDNLTLKQALLLAVIFDVNRTGDSFTTIYEIEHLCILETLPKDLYEFLIKKYIIAP